MEQAALAHARWLEALTGDHQVRRRQLLVTFHQPTSTTSPAAALHRQAEQAAGLLAGIDWTVSRWLTLYPWLGTVSLNYYFKPQHTASSTRLLQFYDALINLIDEDYLPYLDRHEKMSLALQLKTGYDSRKVSP